jgi:peptidoglycan/LPS O-acetylase OafA/YrhL
MNRNKQIDFLRFCGVFLVMINHIIILGNSRLDRVLNVLKTGGWIGVDLFFVLSGYLVSGLIIKEYKLHHSFNPTRFLIRRGFKIYPSYYLFLAIAFIFFTHFTKEPQNKAGLLHEAIFVSNYFSFNNQHTWSISIEEHFYFLLSILFYLLIKFKRVNLKIFVYTYLFVFVIGISCRLYNYLTYTDYDFARDYEKSHFRFDALFFGVLLSYIAHYRADIIDKLLAHRSRIILLAICFVFIASNFVLNREDYRFVSVLNLALNPICFGYIMINCIAITNQTFIKIISPLAYIGKYSYSIYLFHTLFMAIAIHTFKGGGLLYYAAYLSGAIIGGMVMSKLVEYPVINIREKYFPSKSGKPDPDIITHKIEKM